MKSLMVVAAFGLLVCGLGYTSPQDDKTQIKTETPCGCDYTLTDRKTYDGKECPDQAKDILVGGGLYDKADRFHVTCAKIKIDCHCAPRDE